MMSIVVDKVKDQFFISICQRKEHSFVMLGVYDQDRVRHLLCRVGKIMGNVTNHGEELCVSITKAVGNFFFNSVRAKLKDEGITRDYLGETPIKYQAYDITYEQYIEFVRFLESIQTERNTFSCFKPIKEKEGKVTLEVTNVPIFKLTTNVDNLKSEIFNELSIINTCRHSAIKLVEQTQKNSISPEVSSWFFNDLPYETKLDYGQPSSSVPFYVLPFSPTTYHDLTGKKKLVAEKLYHRMEQLVYLETSSPKTQKKFYSLKNLYTQILGAQKEITLSQLLEGIKCWKKENEGTINSLRKTYLWDSFLTRKSKTMELIEEIEQDLQQKNC